MPSSSGAFRLLVIKPKMIGDTLLLAPALEALQRCRPDIDLTLLVRGGTQGILAGTSVNGRVWVTQPPNSDGAKARSSNGKLVRQLRGEHFDAVCELTGTDRGRYLTLLSRAQRKVFGPREPRRKLEGLWRPFGEVPSFPDWEKWHAVQRDWELLRQSLDLPPQDLQLTYRGEPPPSPWAAHGQRQVVVHPVTRWRAKEWPETRWQDLVVWLAGKIDRVLISTGPGGEEVALARRLAQGLKNVDCTEGRLPWNQLAGVLKESCGFVGVDTAAMHLAAACGTPIVAIWGPSKEHIWAPWSDAGGIVVDDTLISLADARSRIAVAAEKRTAAANQSATVQRAIQELLLR